MFNAHIKNFEEGMKEKEDGWTSWFISIKQ
jgi:hypothetical protein